MADTYTVVKGDTLGAIAAKLLGDWSRWPELLELNPDSVSKPGDVTTLQIGAVLTLPGDTKTTTGGGGGGDTGPTPLDPNAGIGDDPVEFNDVVLPAGGRLVAIKNPEGSDANKLWYIVYEWNGIEMAYEIGTGKELNDLFGVSSADELGLDITVMGQNKFEDQGFVLTGGVGQILGSTESLASQIEREVNALGLEDIPGWLAKSPEALFLVATATAEDWSEGRLWQELSSTKAFENRFGGAIDMYLQGGVTIQQAVEDLVADENALRDAIRPWVGDLPEAQTINFLHEMLSNGWTATAAAQVLEQADILRSDPTSFTQANLILEASGLGSLDEVEFLNALNGFGVPDVVEALNTAAAATALADAGLEDVDIDLLMEVVDTSDRLLTADSFAALTQELATNIIRFGAEIDTTKLGFTRDDLIAAAFGEKNPNGKTPGEVINLLSRFERDRQAAGSGYEQSTGFQDARGRLRIAGLGGL